MGEEVEQSQARESDKAWRMRIHSGLVVLTEAEESEGCAVGRPQSSGRNRA